MTASYSSRKGGHIWQKGAATLKPYWQEQDVQP